MGQLEFNHSHSLDFEFYFFTKYRVGHENTTKGTGLKTEDQKPMSELESTDTDDYFESAAGGMLPLKHRIMVEKSGNKVSINDETPNVFLFSGNVIS